MPGAGQGTRRRSGKDGVVEVSGREVAVRGQWYEGHTETQRAHPRPTRAVPQPQCHRGAECVCVCVWWCGTGEGLHQTVRLDRRLRSLE